mmetsp:Transcript_2607/g.6076  ORF Transcript_2607/g.6076 Transcript_2607/m.6076 type:complete len:191 (-) Transcript_2607:351-923(-)
MNKLLMKIFSVDSVKNCSISFAPQIISSSATATAISNISVDSKLVQDIAQNIQTAAESLTKGLNLANVSVSSSIIHNYTSIAAAAATSMTTTCSQSVSNINIQSVSNMECDSSDESLNRIQFASQAIDSNAIFNCAANDAATTDAMTDLKQVLDADSQATTQGISLAGLFILFLALGGLFLSFLRFSQGS